MAAESKALRIYFGRGLADLHHVGYFATDLSQLYVLCCLVEREHPEIARRYLAVPSEDLARLLLSHWPGRSSSIAREWAPELEIRSARGGSLELIVTCGSLLANIVMPILAIEVQRRLQPSEMFFEIAAKDPDVQSTLNAYASGVFGSGPDALNRLFAALHAQNYSVELKGQDAYLISRMLNRYAQRMVRTVVRR